MSTHFSTLGEIIRVTSDEIIWCSWYDSNDPSRFISPKFRLPNCKNGNVDCHLFMDYTQRKIGIKNVSQELGAVVISGHINTNCYPDQNFAIVKQEVTDELSFNFSSLCSSIVFHVSEANLCSQIKTVSAVAKRLCTSRFVTDMENLLLSEVNYTDVEIHCKDGRMLKCHKNLLAARSPVFKTMLESDFNEGKSGVIKLDYMELEFVKDLLNFIYCGNLKNPENAMKLLEAADMFQIQDLKDVCVELLSTKMTVDNVLEILLAADRYLLSELKTSAMALVVQNAKSLVNTPKFNEFCTECADKQLIIDIVKAQANK